MKCISATRLVTCGVSTPRRTARPYSIFTRTLSPTHPTGRDRLRSAPRRMLPALLRQSPASAAWCCGGSATAAAAAAVGASASASAFLLRSSSSSGGGPAPRRRPCSGGPMQQACARVPLTTRPGLIDGRIQRPSPPFPQHGYFAHTHDHNQRRGFLQAAGGDWEETWRRQTTPWDTGGSKMSHLLIRSVPPTVSIPTDRLTHHPSSQTGSPRAAAPPAAAADRRLRALAAGTGEEPGARRRVRERVRLLDAGPARLAGHGAGPLPDGREAGAAVAGGGGAAAGGGQRAVEG